LHASQEALNPGPNKQDTTGCIRVSEKTPSETFRKVPTSFDLKAQKPAKQVDEFSFALLKASCKEAVIPIQTLFGQFL
jgi:hypothetical protein